MLKIVQRGLLIPKPDIVLKYVQHIPMAILMIEHVKQNALKNLLSYMLQTIQTYAKLHASNNIILMLMTQQIDVFKFAQLIKIYLLKRSL